jgi:hypothetical protein
LTAWASETGAVADQRSPAELAFAIDSLRCRLRSIDRELDSLCPYMRRAGELNEQRLKVVAELAELAKRTHEAK